jgi:triacylglycerol lipase
MQPPIQAQAGVSELPKSTRRLQHLLFAVLLGEAALAGLLWYWFRDAWLVLVLVVVFGLLWRTSVVFSGFVFAYALGDRRGSVGACLGAFASEWEAVTTLYHWHQLSSAPRIDIDATAPLPTVLFAHGFVCNAGMWQPCLRQLQQAPHGRLVAISMEPIYWSIEANLMHLKAAVDALFAESATPLILVGHSMGGVTARLYLQRYGGEGKVARIISIGAPHAGTVMAYLIGGSERGPAALSASWLPVHHAETAGSATLNILSDQDNIVVPQRSANWRAAAREQSFSGYGHLALVTKAAPLAFLVTELRHATAATR